MSAPPLIEAIALTKHYEVRRGLFARPRILHALLDVCFAVPRGSTFGLVGESGSGKTTTARLLMGAEPPTSGTIRVDNRAVNGTGAAWLHQKLQPVLQNPYASLNPRMRIDEIVAEPLRVHRREPRGEAQVARLLVQAGLPESLANRYPRELSGGQRQRVAIARALALEPEILVLDEPVSALDVSVQAQLLNMLDDLRRERGLTYFMISHDLAVVAHMATQIGVLYLGALMEIGPADAVLTEPRHPYTRALIAAAEPERGAEFPALRGEIPSPLDPPAGCPFHPRCPDVMPRCHRERPVPRQVSPGHHVTCHLA